MTCPSIFLTKIWTCFIPCNSRQIFDIRIKTRSPRAVICVVVILLTIKLFVGFRITFFPMIDIQFTISSICTTTIFFLQFCVVVSCSPSQSITDINLLMSLTFLSVIGCNDNSTIATTYTIQRSSSWTLQDINPCHVVHIDSGSLCNDSINNVNWFCSCTIRQSGSTTQND